MWTYVSLESLGLVDGKDEIDVLVRLEGACEEGAVLGLCDPQALFFQSE